MKIIFAGTPIFAVEILQALLAARHEIIAVLTQPDRPAGRGRHLTPSPVKQLAIAQSISVYSFIKLDAAAQQIISEWQPDLMVVAAYGLILPKKVLAIPPLGCINVHASLLPCWRGAAPIPRAIQAGDKMSGVTIMQMDAGLDTGDMLLQTPCSIDARETSQTLHDKLALLGATSLIDVLAELTKFPPTPQPAEGASYAHKLTKEEGKIDWNLPVATIDCHVRAMNPWPISWSSLDGQIIRIFEIEPCDGDHAYHAPGEILNSAAHEICVATGDYPCKIKRLQLAGGKILPAEALLKAHAKLFSAGKQWRR